MAVGGLTVSTGSASIDLGHFDRAILAASRATTAYSIGMKNSACCPQL